MDNVLFWSLLLTVAGLIVFLVLSRWRTGIIIVFIWLYFEDVVRRLLPGQPPEVKLITDGLVLILYLSFLAATTVQRAGVSSSWRPPFLTGLIVFLCVSVIGALNPHSPGTLFSLLGFRSYFWYLPFVFLGYSMFTEDRALEKFCRALVSTSIPLTLLAIVQFLFFESESPLIKPLEGGIPYHSFSLVEGPGVPSISSVFGSGARYSRFSLLLFLLGLALWAGRPPEERKPMLLLATASAAVGVLISGSRTAMYLLPVAFGWFALAVSIGGGRRFVKRYLRQLPVIGIAGVVAFLAVFRWLPDIKVWFVYSLPEIHARLGLWTPGDIASAIARGGLFGNGLGSMSQGLQYVAGGAEWTEHQRMLGGGESLESGVGKLIFELGLAGVVAFYAFIARVFLTCRGEIASHGEGFRRAIVVSSWIYLGCLVFWFSLVHHQVFGDATTLIPLWFFIGVAFGLRRFSIGPLESAAELVGR